VHLRVDAILVLAADRNLQLVPRGRQAERAADADERTRDGERDVAPGALLLDLGLLAQTLRVEQGGEGEADEEDDDSPAGRCPEQAH
jgi:hypothetical protein